MAEAMNRAARRASGDEPIRVRVRNRIDVVPMEHVETYLAHEIAREGKWGGDRKLIVVRPNEDAGRSDGAWFARTLERMRETRRRKGTLPIKIAIAEGRELEIDVGLVDVTVFFQAPPGLPPLRPRTRAEFDMAYTENFRHFDSLCAGALHDQMIIASAAHGFHSDGSTLFHYHNLIFGLRQEVHGPMDILAPLDIDPLVQKLAASGPLNVIGGMKQ